jgi:hypothetical protein
MTKKEELKSLYKCFNAKILEAISINGGHFFNPNSTKESVVAAIIKSNKYSDEFSELAGKEESSLFYTKLDNILGNFDCSKATPNSNMTKHHEISGKIAPILIDEMFGE